MWAISMVSLSVVLVLCALGVFAGAFKDNFLQRVGMGVLAIAACGRLWQLWLSGVNDGIFVFYLGVAIYAAGTASKVVAYHGREHRWRFVMDMDRWLFNRKSSADEFDDRPHHHHHL